MNDESKRDQSAVRSFRVTDGTMERFQSIREEMGLTQESALAMLVSTYEMEKAKEMIPDRETEIANFQTKARELVDAFLFSLQLNQDAEVRIRQEFERELSRNQVLLDEKIEDLAKMRAEMALCQSKAIRAGDLEQELEEQQRKNEWLTKDYTERLAEKDRVISTLDGRMEMLEIQAAGYPELKDERDKLAASLSSVQADMKAQAKDHVVALERAARTAEKALDAAVAAAKADGEAKIAELREQLQEAKIAGVRELQAAEKVAHEADMAAAAEIRKLEQENARLREQMAELRAKLPKEE